MCGGPPSGWPTTLRTAGLEHVAVEETSLHPVVYADWLHAEGAPTVLIYGHYDVQPVDPLDLWTSPPFEPVIVDGRMLARGSADDKGQIHAHAMAAAAILATRGGVPDQCQVRVRGCRGELLGGPGGVARGEQGPAGGGRRDHQRHGLLRGQHPGHHGQPAWADVRPDRRRGLGGGPALGRLRRRGPEPGQRAGPDHRRAQGPGRPDPHPGVLRRGRRRSPTRSARAIADLPFDEEAYRRASHIQGLVGEVGYSTLERRATRPTLDVNGLWGGFQGAGAKTIIPAHAHAKVSCRLVAAQDPADIFEKFRDFVLADRAPGCQGHGRGPRWRAGPAARPSITR